MSLYEKILTNFFCKVYMHNFSFTFIFFYFQTPVLTKKLGKFSKSIWKKWLNENPNSNKLSTPRIASAYARKVETEGDPVRVDLKKERRSDKTCSAILGSDGFFLLEVPMTPDHHECAANYQVWWKLLLYKVCLSYKENNIF